MKNTFFTKKSTWVGIVLLLVVVVGIAFFMRDLAKPAEATSTSSVSAEALDTPKNDEKTFRQTLSDLAWGRGRKGAPALKQDARVAATAQVDDSPETQQKVMMTLQSRMAYCAQNWQKDPSCGKQTQPNNGKQ